MGYADEPRPCMVNGARALCHGLFEVEQPFIVEGESKGNFKSVRAAVEYYNGSMELIKPNGLRFLDSDRVFSRYDWGDSDGG